MEEAEDKATMDAGLITEVQRVEHYEISGYGTAVSQAKELGQDSIAKQLQEILDEEFNTDNKLDKLAESRLNRKAMA